MYISDSVGSIVAVQDNEDKKRLNLVNPESGEIHIKISEANKYNFYYFAYENAKGLDVIIPMNLILDDGVKKGGEYIYKFVWENEQRN